LFAFRLVVTHRLLLGIKTQQQASTLDTTNEPTRTITTRRQLNEEPWDAIKAT